MTELRTSPAAPDLHASSMALINAVQRLSLARGIGEVQEIVRTTARRLCGADGATFVLRDGDRCYYADEDAISPLWKGQRFPLNACISGWAMLNRRSTAIEDIYQDDRIPHDAYRPTFVRSLAMVPIRSVDPIGAIGNYWAHHHAATPEELDLLQALADATAVALENVALWSEMESRVADRTAKLQEALALHERLLGTLAHEVRSPLSGAQGLISLVLEDPDADLGPAQREDLRYAQAAVTDGLRIVSEQLDLAKMRAGRLTLHPTPVDAAELLDELAATYRGLRRNERVALVTAPEPGLPTLSTDRHLLVQVLRNLVSNGLKFTDEGEVRIAAAHRPETGEIAFSVIDTGVGISEEDQERIFEEFAQVDGDQGGRADGTGLGLPFVRRVASVLGARLELESRRGEGSVFTLTIPIGAPG
jgi:signal transduction histidine kinase